MLAPPSSRWVANEWRKVWGLMCFVMPARAAACLMMVKSITRVSLPPRLLRKTASSLVVTSRRFSR